jgi:hypothetical protein
MGAVVSCTLTFSHFGKIAKELEPNVIKALDETAAAIEARAKASMAGEKHGRTYGSGAAKTRALRKSERAGLSYRNIFGRPSLRTATGLAAYQSPRSGRVRVVIAVKIHRASAPGESPAIDKGALVNSIHTRKAGKFAREVATNAEQAKALEFGFAPHNLQPRPFMKPAAEAEGPAFQARMKKALTW